MSLKRKLCQIAVAAVFALTLSGCAVLRGASIATAYTVTVPFRVVCTVPGAIPLMFPVASILFRTWLNPLDAAGLCWTVGADAGLGDVASGALEAAGEVAEAATDSGVIEAIEDYGDIKQEQQAAKEAQKKAEQEAQQTAALERERQQEKRERERERAQAEREAQEKSEHVTTLERESARQRRKIINRPTDGNGRECVQIERDTTWATSSKKYCVRRLPQYGGCQDLVYIARFKNVCDKTMAVEWGWHDKYARGKYARGRKKIINSRELWLKPGKTRKTSCEKSRHECTGKLTWNYFYDPVHHGPGVRQP